MGLFSDIDKKERRTTWERKCIIPCGCCMSNDDNFSIFMWLYFIPLCMRKGECCKCFGTSYDCCSFLIFPMICTTDEKSCGKCGCDPFCCFK